MNIKQNFLFVFLAAIICLISLFSMTSCNDIESTLLGDQVYLVPASYDGRVALETDDSDDWEWKVDPKPQGEYKYEWEIWSKSANGEISVIKSWEEYNGTAYYKFTKAGEYEIKVDIVNKSDDTIAEASAKVITRNIILTASEDWIRPGQEAVFTIKDENPPKDPVYEWDFEDGSGSQWETDTTKKHVFENPGWYSVSVALREQGSTNDDDPSGSQSGTLAADGIIIQVGHPATLLVPQSPLYAGVKYEFSLEYDGELPSGHDYWWVFPGVGEWRTDSNKFEMIFPKEGTYAVRGEVRHPVTRNDIGRDQIYAFGEQTISVAKTPELTINVPQPPLQTGKEYTFNAVHESPEKLTDEPYYEWDFGDGSGIGIPFNNEAIHMYAKEGNYTVSVTLYDSDKAGATVLGVATTRITVEAGAVNALSYLQQTTHLSVSVSGDTTYHQSDGYTIENEVLRFGVYSPLAATTWNGTHFTCRYFAPPTDTRSGLTVTIEGDVSEEGDKIINVTATIVYDDSHRLTGEQRETRISIANVKLEPASPIPTNPDPNYKPKFIAYVEGPDVANYVTTTFYEHKQPQISDPDFKIWYDTLTYTGTKFTPYLLIVFKTERIDAYDDPGRSTRD